MLSIRTMMDEGVQQLRTVRALRDDAILSYSAHQVLVIFVVLTDRISPFFSIPIFGNLIKNIHFVVSCLYIVLSALLNLQSNVAVEFKIFGQPNSRKVTPSELLDNHISVE